MFLRILKRGSEGGGKSAGKREKKHHGVLGRGVPGRALRGTANSLGGFNHGNIRKDSSIKWNYLSIWECFTQYVLDLFHTYMICHILTVA